MTGPSSEEEAFKVAGDPHTVELADAIRFQAEHGTPDSVTLTADPTKADWRLVVERRGGHLYVLESRELG